MSCSSIRSTVTLCIMYTVGHSVLLKVIHAWISIIKTGYFQISHQTRSGVSRFYLENVAHLSVNRRSRQQVKQNRMYLVVIAIVYAWEEALQVCEVKQKVGGNIVRHMKSLQTNRKIARSRQHKEVLWRQRTNELSALVKCVQWSGRSCWGGGWLPPH